MASDIDNLLREYDALKSDRSVLNSHLQEIRDYLRPLAASFTSSNVAGAKDREKVLDSSGETASDVLASSVHGFLTNPGTKWFGLRARDRELMRDGDVKRWFESVVAIMLTVFESPESGFASELDQDYHELADFGTSVMYIADRPGKLPLYQAQPLSDCFVAENDEGRIDTMFRRFKLSARQAVRKWQNNAGAKVIKAAEGNTPEERFEFLHVVKLRDNAKSGLLASTALPFTSDWLSIEDKTQIAKSGYHEMPYIVGRWSKRTGEVYGRGPGMVALADVKMLQRSMRITIRSIEKAVAPALMVAHDGVLGNVRMGDSAINIVRADLLTGRLPPIQPILTGGQPELGEKFMAGVRLRIERAYFNHLLQLLRDPRMTATQTLEIKEETLRILGPFLGRIQNEKVGPIITRTFAILFRMSAFPPMPAVLEGREFEVEYVSPIARAQRISDVRAVSQWWDVIAPVAASDKTILDNVDVDQFARHSADRLAVPRDIVRDERAVKAIRDARAEAEKRAAQAEGLERAAAAAQSAGQALGAFQNAGQNARSA